MADAALTADGLIRCKFARGIYPKPVLRMGIMAIDTTLIIIYAYICLIAMRSLYQFIPDLIMAGYTFFMVKEIRQFFIYITGIGVDIPAIDIFVTIYTRKLAMGRYVEIPRVYNPG